jgi:hypothetical protein
MEKVLSVIAAIIGTTLVIVALGHLVPGGMWLYLGSLVLGSQLVVMAIRNAINQEDAE